VHITIKPPGDCETNELSEFVKAVMQGGEVAPVGLDRRVSQAHVLAFAREGQDLCGVAALKSPRGGYRKSIFTKTGATIPAIEYPLELGWLFVAPGNRGNGISQSLVGSVLAHAGSKSVFATTRTDNAAMRTVLLKSGFIRHGQDYESNRGTHKLTLFLHQKTQ